MARARKKNTPKLPKTSPTLASGAAEMNGAASAAFAGGKADDKPKRPPFDLLSEMIWAIFAPVVAAEQITKQFAEQRRQLSKALTQLKRRADPSEAEAGVMARRLPGRPREYDRDAIIVVAKDCAKKGVEDYLDRFVERVRVEYKNRHNKKAPKPTQMEEILRPIWNDERAKSAKK